MMKKLGTILLDILCVLAIFSVVIVCSYIYQLKIQGKRYANIFNMSLFTICSGSMKPTLEIGDNVFVKVGNKNLSENDIVVYDDGSSFICHRIVKKIDDYTYVCKGDNNNANDEEISSYQIVGKVIHISKRAGLVQNFLRKPYVFIIVIDLIIVFAVFNYFNKKKAQNS